MPSIKPQSPPPPSTNVPGVEDDPVVELAVQYEEMFNEMVPSEAFRREDAWLVPKLENALATGKPVPEFAGLPKWGSVIVGPRDKNE